MVYCNDQRIFFFSNLNTWKHKNTNVRRRKHKNTKCFKKISNLNTWKHKNTKVRRRKLKNTKSFQVGNYQVFIIVLLCFCHHVFVFKFFVNMFLSSCFRIFVFATLRFCVQTFMCSSLRMWRLLNRNAMALMEHCNKQVGQNEK